MTDCTNGELRDLLPLLAHDALEAGDAARVRQHLATCADCRTELALLATARDAFDAATPVISTTAIVAGVQRAMRPRAVPRPTPHRAYGRRWMPGRLVAAAASLVLVASVSLTVLARNFGAPAAGQADGDTVMVASGPRDSASEVRLFASAGLSVTGGLSDLSDDELTTLLDELDSVEATIDAEPSTLRHALIEDPGGF
ncbi:MAG: zf-HC2 domain-containing protein [Gemmatimonadaceae bacterium]